MTSTKISALKRLYNHLFCKGLVFMLCYLYILAHTGVLYQLHDGYHYWDRNCLPVRSTLFHQRILVSCVSFCPFSLFVIALSLFFSSNLRFLIFPLVSSNFLYYQKPWERGFKLIMIIFPHDNCS